MNLPKDLPLTVDGMMRFLETAPPETVAEVQRMVAPVLARGWLPQMGPQYRAFHSKADELLYGGAAGGGKTDLLVGLATTAHRRSLIFRRHSADLDGFWDRLQEVVAERAASNNSVKKVMVTDDGRKIEGGHLEKPGSERSWQGRPHDLIGCDEGAQLDEHKVAFVIQWLRSVEGHRCRLVVATNPPLPEIIGGKLVDNGTGDWLVRWWAPWLDPNFDNPAKDGELRWCFTKANGDEIKTIWVPGPGYYNPETGEPFPNATPDDVTKGRAVSAKSRTFIQSLLKDNLYLADTGYLEKLSTTPEPMRSMLISGTFGLRLADSELQVIPTNWVLMANERWREREHGMKNKRQLLLSADVAQGGIDNSTFVPLYDDDTFGELRKVPGVDTPDGQSVVTNLLDMRRDASMIVLDGTGGWAGAAAENLRTLHKIEAEMVVASNASGEMDKSLTYSLPLVRDAMWWTFREALDPDSEYEIALPPDPRLLAQLTAPQFAFQRIGNRTAIKIESKDEVRKRIGASTDDADCVIQGWWKRHDALMERLQRKDSIVERYNKKQRGADGEPGAPEPMGDPFDLS